MKLPVNFTRYESKSPCTKYYTLEQGGKIVSQRKYIPFCDGWGHRVQCDFSEFGQFLGLDDVHTVLGYGVLGNEGEYPDKVKICVKKILGDWRNFDAVSRSKDFFVHPYGTPGIVMLDYDPHPNGTSFTPESLIEAICAIMPSFADCAKWIMPSVSSGVRRSGESKKDENGTEPDRGGKKGFHLYVAVPDLSDVTRFGNALFERLCLAGYGYHKVGDDGHLHYKSPIDRAVTKSSERIDYVGKPMLGEGLEWDKVPTTYIEGGYLDTRLCTSLSLDEDEVFKKMKTESHIKHKPEAERQHKIYKEKHPIKVAGVAKRVKAGQSKADAEAEFDKILLEMFGEMPEGSDTRYVDLPPSFTVEGPYLDKMEVRELLKRGEELNETVLFDPREPDYSPTVAMFFWNGGENPVIHSFAHGKTIYFLHGDVLDGVESWFRRGCLISWTRPNKNGESKVVKMIDSLAADLFSRVLKGHYARRAVNKTVFKFNSRHWEACTEGHWDVVLSKLMKAGCEPVGYTSRYWGSVKTALETSGTLSLPEAEEGWIPFANTLLDPKTKKTRKITSENAYTWSLPWEYDAEAKCVFFLSWLRQATDNEPSSINLVRAFLNACLVGRSDLQKFLYIKGEGGTGKGTLLRILESMLGEENCATTELKLLDDNRFETAAIVDKRLVSISDAERYKGSMMKIKALTGEDNMRCEDKHITRHYQRRFKGMVVILSNEQPGGTDYTSGFFRRLIVLKLNKRFTDEERAAFSKKKGEDILRSEIPGIVNWALDMSWDEVSKAFSGDEGTVAEATAEAMLAQNPVSAFVYECLRPKTDWPDNTPLVLRLTQMGTDRGTKVSDTTGERLYADHEKKIYPAYLQWCARTHRQPSSLVRFADELKGVLAEAGFGTRKKTNTGIGYLGLEIVPDSEKEVIKEESKEENNIVDFRRVRKTMKEAQTG